MDGASVDIQRGACRMQLEPMKRCLRQVSCLPSSRNPELEGTEIQTDSVAPAPG